MWRWRVILGGAAGAGVIAWGGVVFAQEMEGAAKVLAFAQSSQAQNGMGRVEAWEKDAKELAKEVDGLAAEAAVERWLGLYDRFFAFGYWSNWETLHRELFEAMPGPKAWPVLMERARKRAGEGAVKRVPDMYLLFTAGTLMNDGAEQEKALTGMMEAFKGVGLERPAESGVGQARNYLTRWSGEKHIAWMKAEAADQQDKDRVQVPDLADAPGITEAGAREALWTALEGKRWVHLSGPKTQALAVKMATQEVGRLGKPHWELMSPEAGTTALFAAQVERFVPEKLRGKDWGTGAWLEEYAQSEEAGAVKSAAGAYVRRLVEAGEVEKAIAFVKGMSGKMRQEVLEREDIQDAHAAEFWEQAVGMTSDGGAGFWSQYLQASLKAGKEMEAVERYKTWLKSQKLDPLKWMWSYQGLCKMLFAGGRTEAGMEVMEFMLKPRSKDEWTPWEGDDGGFSQGQLLADMQGIGVDLMRISDLMGQKARGDAAAARTWEMLEKADAESTSSWALKALVKRAVDQGSARAAETMAARTLGKYAKHAQKLFDDGDPNPAPGGSDRRRSLGKTNEGLMILAWLYHTVGRHEEVIRLADEAPWWGMTDVAQQLYQGDWGIAQREDMATYLALALARAGRKEEARKLIEAVLDQSPGYDPGYRVLMELGKEQGQKKVDELIARERFEARPLVWKARFLIAENKGAEAQALMRKAMALIKEDDWRGANLESFYSVMAQALKAQGKDAEAQEFEKRGRAALLYAQGREFTELGLPVKAAELYEQSLALDGENAWARLDLAKSLTEMGKKEAGLKAYARGFETLARVLGRDQQWRFSTTLYEIWKDDQLVDLAQKTIKPAAAGAQKGWRGWYLLGLALEGQGRMKEAGQAFKQAVELDGDDAQSWRALEGIDDMYLEDPGLRERAAREVLRLTGDATHSLRDWAGAWAVLEQYPDHRAPERDSIYPLPACPRPLGGMDWGKEQLIYSDREPFVRRTTRSAFVAESALNCLDQPIKSYMARKE